MQEFKKKYNLQARHKKFLKQQKINPNKILLIAQPHSLSSLPELSNPKFLCDKNHLVFMISSILQKKLAEITKKQSSKEPFIVYMNNKIPQRDQTIQNVYQREKDQDGFLYIQYSNMQAFGHENL